MSKGTEWSSGTDATLLHVITFSGFIDLQTSQDIVQVNECLIYGVDDFSSQLNQTNLWVKLLFCPSVAILASLSPLTFTGIPPLLTLFHSWTWQRSVAAKNITATIFFSTSIIIIILNKIHEYCFLLHAVMEHLYLCLCGLRLLSLLLW